MSKKDHRGDFYIDVAQRNGFKVTWGKGDHVKVEGPSGRGYMVFPYKKEMGKGLDCKIKKWFISLGIVFCLASIYFFASQLVQYY